MIDYPFNGSYPITQLYGVNPQDYPNTNGHTGIDWGLPLGTYIYPVLPGKVKFSGWNEQGYGNLVIITHADNITTYYAHFERVNCMVGAEVDKDKCIGLSGNTGNSTGPHLHFEYRVKNKPIDPIGLFGVEPKPEPEAVVFEVNDVAVVNAEILNIRLEPTASSKDLGDLTRGYKVKIAEVSGRWVKIAGPQQAWLCADYLLKA